MTQASTSRPVSVHVSVTLKSKHCIEIALDLAMERDPSNRDSTRPSEETWLKREIEEEDRVSGCLGWFRLV